MFEETIALQPDLFVTVRSETGRAALSKKLIYIALDYPNRNLEDQVLIMDFAALVTQTVRVEGDLGFKWVSAGAPVEDMVAAFNGVMEMSGALLRRWVEAIAAVDRPPNDPELLPVGLVSEAVRTDPK